MCTLAEYKQAHVRSALRMMQALQDLDAYTNFVRTYVPR
ncbi:hypothetical protein APHDU1_0800 [Anaplasma phagocytophilum]|nr:hypothetical protein APHDU1_0800 [Anaplasma phagocytophilum]